MGWGCTFITCHCPWDLMLVQIVSVSSIILTRTPSVLSGCRPYLVGQHAVLLQERCHSAAPCTS